MMSLNSTLNNKHTKPQLLSESYLKPIILKKKERLERFPLPPVKVLEKKISALRNKPLNFKNALQRAKHIALIGEIKKASPSLGLIQAQFDPVKQASYYEMAGLSAISVLSEEDFFLGHADHVRQVAASTTLPVLRKDFIVDLSQIYESRLLGASAVLLICAVLDDALLKQMIQLARQLSLDALVEIHNLNELMRALAADADLIGINNRDLNTFHVDLSVTERLAGLIPSDKMIVSESGIKTAADMARVYRAGARAALVGESLMRTDPSLPAITRRVQELKGDLPR